MKQDRTKKLKIFDEKEVDIKNEVRRKNSSIKIKAKYISKRLSLKKRRKSNFPSFIRPKSKEINIKDIALNF